MKAFASVTVRQGTTPYQVHLEDDLGHTWLADEPDDLQGGNLGPSPTRLLIASLGACTAITLRMYAERKQWPLKGVRVELKLLTDVPVPEGGTQILREITLEGPLRPEQRERLLGIANACPVHRMLTGTIHVETRLDDAV